jgi:hypothetical protein
MNQRDLERRIAEHTARREQEQREAEEARATLLAERRAAEEATRARIDAEQAEARRVLHEDARSRMTSKQKALMDGLQSNDPDTLEALKSEFRNRRTGAGQWIAEADRLRATEPA